MGGRLLRDVPFVLLWAGQTLSQLGSQFTFLALPAAAILALHAGPFQVGLLEALAFLAFPTLGLLAGVYADRLHRRRIMIVCDLGRMVALASIPAAYAVGALSMPLLYLVALVTGVFTVFFDIAYQSHLPALIQRADLVEGNSKLEVSRGVAQVAGPVIGGLLLQCGGRCPRHRHRRGLLWRLRALTVGHPPTRARTCARHHLRSQRSLGRGVGRHSGRAD